MKSSGDTPLGVGVEFFSGLGMDLHDFLHLEWLCVAFRGHLLGDQPPTQSLDTQKMMKKRPVLLGI